jgi:hypothetical protein
MSGEFMILLANTPTPAKRGTIWRHSASIVWSVASTISPIAARDATPPSSVWAMWCRLTRRLWSVAAIVILVYRLPAASARPVTSIAVGS